MLQCCFQMVCDAQRRITSCLATSPGSVHDSRVFRRSGLCRLFETGVHSSFLLGETVNPAEDTIQPFPDGRQGKWKRKRQEPEKEDSLVAVMRNAVRRIAS